MAKKFNIKAYQDKCKATIEKLFDEAHDIEISIFDASTKEKTSLSDLAIKALTKTIPDFYKASKGIETKVKKEKEEGKEVKAEEYVKRRE
jgi:20S proteasome alpha/beta subunit